MKRILKYSLPLLLALTVVLSTAAFPAAAASGNAAVIQGRIDAVLATFGITDDMTDDEIANAIAAKDGETIRATMDEMTAIEDSARALTEVEFAELDADLYGRFCDVMERLYNPEVVTNVSALDGNLTIADSKNTGKLSNDVYTATANGSLFSKATNNITITNNLESEATLSFKYTVASANSFDVNGNTTESSGTVSAKLAAGGTVTISITSNNGLSNTTVTLTLENLKLEAVAESSVVTIKYDSTLGSVTAGGSSIANNGTVDVTSDGIALVAPPTSSGQFVGWRDTSNNAKIELVDGLYIPTESTATLEAVFVKKDGTSTAWFLAGGDHMYDDLNAAASYANTANTKTVILLNSGILPALTDDTSTTDVDESIYTIPSGVTLLIPYNDENTLITDDMSDHVNVNYDAPPAKELYQQLTMPDGTNITVNGAISVGSQALNQMIGQVGPYGCIVMDEGSNITVKNGGSLYAYGYIFYGEGDGGTVTVENGGKVYECLTTPDYDYAGGVTDVYAEKAFPLRSYTARNIEVPTTYHYGAKGYVFFCTYSGTFNITYGDYILFIGTDASSPFQLASGSNLVKSYVNGRQRVTVNGNSTLNAISLKIQTTLNTTTISSSSTSGFPVPSEYDITVASGVMTLNDNVIMTEGSTITIVTGATIDANSKNIYVLDSVEDPGSVKTSDAYSRDTADVHGTYYTHVDQDAILEVNGTLKASGGFFTSASGACITSSGDGVIEITAASAETSINIKTIEFDKALNSTYFTCSFYQASLLNKNTENGVLSLYTASAAGKYYYHASHQRWVKDVHSFEATTYTWGNDNASCTASRKCSCGITETADATSVTDQVTLEPTCTDAGEKTFTAAFAVDWASTQTQTASVDSKGGHSWQDATFEAPKTCSVCGATEGDKLTAVAKIGSTRYTSLSAAYADLIDGDTIVILNASAFDEDVTFGKCCTIDASAIDASALDSFAVNVDEEAGYTAVDKSGGIWYVNTSLFDIYASNLKAGDSLDLYFYIQATDLTEEPSAYTAKIVRYRQGVADAAVSISGSQWTAYGSDYYRFCYGDIAAKEMTDKLFITICKDGVKVSDTRMESVENYALRVLKSVADAETGSENAALRTTLVDMLCYGAECQDYFEDYNIANRADANISNYLEYASEDQTANNNASGDTDYVAGTSVSAKTSLVYTFYFYDTMVTSDMAAYVSYTNHSGAEVTLPVITGDAFSTTTSGCLGVNVTGLAVADGRQIITCVIKDSDNEDASTVTTVSGSVESYISTDKSNPALQKLMNFIVSAHAYFHHSGT